MHIKDIKNKLKVLKKRAQGSVGTAIKVLTAVVLGAAILVGGYALTNEVVLPNITEKVESMFAYSADAEGNTGGLIQPTVEPLVFRFETPLSEARGVKVDGVTVDESNYTLTEGSTIITFSGEYSASLAEGAHEIGLIVDSGLATKNFTVEPTSVPEEGEIRTFTAYVHDGSCILTGDKVEFTYEYGMTWGEFCASEYNLDGIFRNVTQEWMDEMEISGFDVGSIILEYSGTPDFGHKTSDGTDAFRRIGIRSEDLIDEALLYVIAYDYI